MPETSIQKNSTSQSINLRFVTNDPVGTATVDDTTTGLELWYRREGEERVDITPAALDSLLSPYTSGGIEPIDDGYSRLDIPDEALEAGADSVQIGGSADGITGIGFYITLTAPTATGSSSISSGGTQMVSCSVMLPEAPLSSHDGCPITTKRRHIPVPKGLCGTAAWTMRLPNGLAANFSDCLGSDSDSESESEDEFEIKVRFAGCDGNRVLEEVDGTVVNTATGLIEFTLPDCVCQNAGIYQFQAALMDGDNPVFIDGGLISVERGLWGNYTNMKGPPTIAEIRFATRDKAEENNLLLDVEFEDADILDAIRWPVFKFNETPPNLGRQYNCNNFPFRYHWVQAIVGRLLTAAAHHYVRNKMQAASGGLNVDDKNKDTDYLRFAQLYKQEWDEFVVLKKIELNAAQAYGHLGSTYGGGGGVW